MNTNNTKVNNNVKKYIDVETYENHSSFISNSTGFEYSILPYTINPTGPINNTIEDINLFKKFPQAVGAQLLPFGKYTVPITLDPRPAVKIGYELRN